MKLFAIVFVCLSIPLFLLSACAQRSAYGACARRLPTAECFASATRPAVKDADIPATAYQSVDALLAALPPDWGMAPLVVAGMADLGHMHTTTPLGRLLAESFAARFTQRGREVLEIQFSATLDPAHELARLRQERAVGIVCAGTYSVADNQVYITVKLLDLDGMALAAHSFSLPLGPNTLALLQETLEP